MALGMVLWCGVCAMPLPAEAGAASSPQTMLAEAYTTRVWQTQDGLPQQTVQAVGQTRDGFLWIGTTGGLLRFDGSHFVIFDRGNTPALQENSIFTLMSGRDGTLWIGTEGGGLVLMRGGQFRHVGSADGLLDGFVRTVQEDREGTIWIGTDNGLYRMSGSEANRVTRVDGAALIPVLAVHALLLANDGAMWAGGSRLVAIRKGVATEYPLVGQYSETRVKSILQTQDGTLWVGTVSGLQRLAPGAKSFARVAGVQGTVRTLRTTQDGTLWIGTIGQGAYILREGRLTAVGSGAAGGTSVREALRLPSKTILSLFEDADHNLWMGTQAGVVRFSRSPMELVPLPNAEDSDFETVSRDSDGSLWVASTQLSRVANGVAAPVTFPELNGARVRNVFRAGDGALWIGTDGRGVFRLRKGEAPSQYTTANGLVNNFVRGVLQGKNGDLWIATDEGVSRFSHGALRSFTVADGLAYFSVRAILEDRSGDLWIGTDRGLSHLVGDRFVQDTATKALAGEKVWALDQSASGALWFGTRDNGMYRDDAGRITHYTTEQGLASNSIFSILEDARGRFWIGGANGVEVISISDLERRAQDPQTPISHRFYAVSQGGDLSPLYGGTTPAGVMTPEGDAWFPTSKGPVRFRTGETDSSGVPQVFLDGVVADGRSLALGNEIQLSADNRNLEISYGSILLSPRDAVQFQYKLEGFDSDWRYGSNRRVADYTNLAAGSYTFHVRAFQGSSGRLTEQTLSIVKRQHFYLTWWFLTGCMLIFVLAAVCAYRLKLKRMDAAYRAVIEERARLAREMHDTLIQGCAGVSLLLEAASAQSGEAGSGSQSELLDYARTQLAASIDEARQAVWNLRGQVSMDFGEAIRKLSERVDRGSNIAIDYKAEGETYAFHPTAMREITMASREAIYNALLHANPKRIEVQARFGKDEFLLRIGDDGSGFASDHHAPEGHFGLVGIRERISRLGGSVHVTSAVALGTELYIRVPRSSVCVDGNSLEEAMHGESAE